MKRTKELLVVLVLIIAIIISTYPISNAAMDPTLDDIVSTFNSCKTVKQYNQDEETMNLYASKYVDESNQQSKKYYLRVSVTEESYTTILSYELIGNILTAKYTGGDTKEREYWPEVTNILIDCIEQFHGHSEGEMFETLNSTQVANYTLENEGLMISNGSSTLYLAQIDITKTIPTIDTNSFIKVEDLESLKANLTGDGIAKLKKGKVIFQKNTIDDKDILVVGEQDGFSYLINRSILSILNVMFGSNDAVEYFKENYPSVGANKQFDGFKIEINPIKNSTEETVFGADNSYKFVRITIDRNAVSEALASKNRQSDGSDPGTGIITPPSNSTPTPPTGGTGDSGSISSLPKTGKVVNGVLISLYFIFAVVLAVIIMIGFDAKKKQK